MAKLKNKTVEFFRNTLIWQIEAGIDECIGENPKVCWGKNTTNLKIDHTHSAQVSKINPSQFPTELPGTILTEPQKAESQNIINSNSEPIGKSFLGSIAKLETLDELEKAVKAFDKCPLIKTATNTVFADGNPSSNIFCDSGLCK